ncbi:MAG: hypothetical protein K0R19_3283 [Bacillota bacterium]|jgi:hypothetical protein|nr:hypothetical protein [Bacillota bacterium]
MSREYYQQKKVLLQQCLRFGEEIASSLEEWESISAILTEREALIAQLNELEQNTKEEIKAALTHAMKEELDQTIKLILEFDQNTISLMRKEQENIITSLKTNIQEQKTIQYGASTQPSSGRLMNYGL